MVVHPYMASAMPDEIPIIPPGDLLDYWSSRVPVTPSQMAHISSQYRARAFFVSALSQLDQVSTVHRSLSRAIESGTAMGDWRGEIVDLFGRAGWTKDRFLLDTIFRTNIQSAISAGRWEEAQEGRADHPYGMYDATLDGRTRATHAAQHGKIYPLDHPYWRTWWPLNGMNCRCRVITLSRAQVREMGLKVRDDIPDRTLSEGEKKAAGIDAEKTIIQRPDPGFDSPPGRIAYPVDLSRYSPEILTYFYEALAASEIGREVVDEYLAQ